MTDAAGGEIRADDGMPDDNDAGDINSIGLVR